MPLSSTLKASENPLIFPWGSLVFDSSRLASIVPGQMASTFTVDALGSTLPIVMVVALRAQRFRSPYTFFSLGPAV
ncbi:hypothetical protein Tco_0592850 [Tanacetum coccineum]